ncbi:DUF397 domain-containing protein [Streptomyces sp. JJ66]|uniref:DUF397 domain-containing protein n=1 Tax=Streptomyces sp. JJ66 TaxID=2803843 RepID=UPI001C56BF8E|nr:DUF397 domain-containing protein [Streptomyces sp. JJ66]MBW1602190.1 DUF397 domain-containing protein [Streptomyces sp. JJ66]
MSHAKQQLYATPLDGEWVKSSFSNGSGNNCVQLMAIEGGVAVGDSKRPDLAPLRYTRSGLAAFVAAARAGEFDHFPRR